MKNKSKINEISGVSKFIDAFFTGLRNNTAYRIINKAQDRGLADPVIRKMREIDQNSKDLEELIKKYSK